MPQFSLTSEPHASPEDQQFLRDAVDEFNMDTVNNHDYKPVNIFIRDATGQIVGGVLGDLWGGWLHITRLWVAPALRKQGYGARLLRAAEIEAKHKGCSRAFLETHSFQAPDFYRCYGYMPVGELADYPPGHAYFIMWKEL
jgi:ribosomal protein S18 acetylase RimI-like enzyme